MGSYLKRVKTVYSDFDPEKCPRSREGKKKEKARETTSSSASAPQRSPLKGVVVSDDEQFSSITTALCIFIYVVRNAP